jgi:adenosylcobinamide-phosphate synthase
VEAVQADIIVVASALAIDGLFGEPPVALHPTVWMGRLAESIDRGLRRGGPALERLQGVFLGVLVVGLSSTAAYLGLGLVDRYLGLVPYLLASALLLKTAISVRAMDGFTRPIAEAAEEGDYTKARRLLRNVVRRDPDSLTDQQVLSATIETIAEGTVDGVTGALFLYSILGVPGAIAYRAINTLDSTVGYKDALHLNTGWFSAKLDTVANYVPARITGVLTVISAGILSLDLAGCLRILVRDGSRTESANAGWSMSAMAGALGLLLEKPGFYALGDASREIRPSDIIGALRIMKLNVALFALLVCVPLIFVTRTLVPLA